MQLVMSMYKSFGRMKCWRYCNVLVIRKCWARSL